MEERRAEPAQRDDHPRFPVSVILERRPAVSQWADFVWTAAGIAVGQRSDDTRPTLVGQHTHCAHFLVGGLTVALHADECESYYYNLMSDTPRAFIVAHAGSYDDQPQPFRVTMSFDEAHAYLEGDDQIYAVDIPAELYRWTEAFVVANYFPEKKTKRKLRDWKAETSGEQQP